MNKSLKIFIGACLLVAFLLVLLCQTLPRWLPWVVGYWLPKGSHLTIAKSPVWHLGALQLSELKFDTQGCLLLEVDTIRIAYSQGHWRLHAGMVNLDSTCFSKLVSRNDQAGQMLTLNQWQQRLAVLNVVVERLSVSPWSQYAGKVEFTSLTDSSQTSYQSKISYQGNKLAFNLAFVDQQLYLKQLKMMLPSSDNPLLLRGEMQLPMLLDKLPERGELQGEWNTNYLPQPLLLSLRWQQQEGLLTLTENGSDKPLVRLPWQVAARQIKINQGQWQWPHSQQLLMGGVNVTLAEWSKNFDQAEISARINLITSGQRGKTNSVLTLMPGQISLNNNKLRFQLSGQTSFANVILDASLPGTLTGPLFNPRLALQPGSLLRVYGQLTPELKLQEARWPLSGVTVTAQGISGPLQAIVKVQHQYWGDASLHLDGKAEDFWLDKGYWRWRYWGRGSLLPFGAHWYTAGNGDWREDVINVAKLSTSLDQLTYSMVKVKSPILELKEPLRWSRYAGAAGFSAKLQLAAKKINFNYGGHLPQPTLELQLNGNDPDHFLWHGKLQAQDIGPLRLSGRWDGYRLRGQAWWPEQTLIDLQPLLSADLGWGIRTGKFYAQAAFSAVRKQGFTAGGHWVVKDAGMWLRDGELNGLDFIMPWRWQHNRWQLGTSSPVTLRINTLNKLFVMKNITASLQGAYPWSEQQPLQFRDVGMDVLGGHLSLLALSLPQQTAAVLKLKQIDLSELFTVLKPKQFAMSGKVYGELPFYLNDPHWLVRHGWVANTGPLTLRLDKDLVDAIDNNNFAAGAIIDWLRYVEISHSYARVNVDNLGNLTLSSKVNGVSSQKNAKSIVLLNYQHHENILQLWRSLRFGDNLQKWLQQRISSVPVSFLPLGNME